VCGVECCVCFGYVVVWYVFLGCEVLWVWFGLDVGVVYGSG